MRSTAAAATRSPDKTAACISDSDGGGSSGGAETVTEECSRPVRVVVLGDDEVGKTALLQQFMTSVYMAAAVQTHLGTTPVFNYPLCVSSCPALTLTSAE